MVKFNYFRGKLYKVEETLEIFLIDYYAGI